MDLYKKIEINPKVTVVTECIYFLLGVYGGIAEFLLDLHLYKDRPPDLEPPTTMDYITHYTVPIFLVLTLALGTGYVRKCLSSKSFQIELLSPILFIIGGVSYVTANILAKPFDANFFMLFPTSIYIVLNLVLLAMKLHHAGKVFKKPQVNDSAVQ